jgi:hypothetical protein
VGILSYSLLLFEGVIHMANRYFKQFQGTLEAGIVSLFGSFVTTTSGTIGSQSCKGFSIAKTATETGRYTITFEDKYMGFKSLSATVVGASDAAYTATKGLAPFLRNVDVVSAKTLDLQFADPESSADAELEDGAQVFIEIKLKNSSVY